MPRFALIALILALGLVLSACGEDPEPTSPGEVPASQPEEPQAEDPQAEDGGAARVIAGVEVRRAEDLQVEPIVEVPMDEDPPGRLVSRDLVPGDGPVIRPGDEASMQYTGVSWSNGDKFDASWDRGAEPFSFEVGGGDVIEGWDVGVAGMRVGGRRLLVIPPEMGYGPQGQPPVIAPGETLVFVVDAVARN